MHNKWRQKFVIISDREASWCSLNSQIFGKWVHIVVVNYQESSITPKFYIKPTS